MRVALVVIIEPPGDQPEDCRSIRQWMNASVVALERFDEGFGNAVRLRALHRGKFRDECLSLEWFRSRAEAKIIIEAWRRHYNEVRPHSSLGYLTPNEFAAQCVSAAPHHATGQGAAVCGPSRPGPLHHLPREGQLQQAREAVSS